MRSCECKNINNAGYSLIELIVVIAIIAILTGGMVLGVSLVFSRDAERCATNLNDAIYKARMESMSKAGEYTLKIKLNDRIAEIENNGNVETIYLEGDSTSNKTIILAKFTDVDGNGTSLTNDVNIIFDKAKGCVMTGPGYSFSTDGIVIFDIKGKRGNKTSKVQLITTTGKHKIGDF